MFVGKHRSLLVTASVGLIAIYAVVRSTPAPAPLGVVSDAAARPGRAVHENGRVVLAPGAEATGPWLDRELMVAARDGESLAWIAEEHGATLRRDYRWWWWWWQRAIPDWSESRSG